MHSSVRILWFSKVNSLHSKNCQLQMNKGFTIVLSIHFAKADLNDDRRFYQNNTTCFGQKMKKNPSLQYRWSISTFLSSTTLTQFPEIALTAVCETWHFKGKKKKKKKSFVLALIQKSLSNSLKSLKSPYQKEKCVFLLYSKIKSGPKIFRKKYCKYWS